MLFLYLILHLLKLQQYKINNQEYIKSKAEINLNNEYKNIYKYLKEFIY